MENRMLLGMRIKEIRKAKQLSQEQLSDKVGISPKYLSRIEMGKGNPSLDMLERMSVILDVQLKDFFDFDAYRTELITPDRVSRIFQDLDDEKKRLVFSVLRSISSH